MRAEKQEGGWDMGSGLKAMEQGSSGGSGFMRGVFTALEEAGGGSPVALVPSLWPLVPSELRQWFCL